MEIKGSVAIVTGSSRGIGKSIALKLAEEGGRIVLNYNFHKVEAVKLKDLIEKSYGTDVLVCKANVSNQQEVKTLIQQVIDHFDKIDILVNNAGIKGKQSAIFELSDEEWETVINTNLKGAFNVCKEVVPHMIRQNSGVIINISSIVALMGANVNLAYAASKAGIIGFSFALAAQLSKYKIRVNVIAPGAIDTSWWEGEQEVKKKLSQTCPLGRLGKPEEIAEAVTFLIKNEFVNGAILSIDGGRYAMRNIYCE